MERRIILISLIVCSLSTYGISDDIPHQTESEYLNPDEPSLGSDTLTSSETLAATETETTNNKLGGDVGNVNESFHLKNKELENESFGNSNTSLLVSEDLNENSSTANVSHHVLCLIKNTDGAPVEIVNASRLLTVFQAESNITSRQKPATCVAVLFYSPTCPFSCMAAPHFNALPRIFPGIKMVAVDTMTHHSLNALYGIVGVPTLMLFHNAKPAVKFNETFEYGLEQFAKFITKYTGIQPEGMLVVTSADFKGPVSSVLIKERDYCLILSWIFIFTCAMYFFYRSSWWRLLVDATLNAWREAEAQHHHSD